MEFSMDLRTNSECEASFMNLVNESLPLYSQLEFDLWMHSNARCGIKKMFSLEYLTQLTDSPGKYSSDHFYSPGIISILHQNTGQGRYMQVYRSFAGEGSCRSIAIYTNHGISRLHNY